MECTANCTSSEFRRKENIFIEHIHIQLFLWSIYIYSYSYRAYTYIVILLMEKRLYKMQCLFRYHFADFFVGRACLLFRYYYQPAKADGSLIYRGMSLNFQFCLWFWYQKNLAQKSVRSKFKSTGKVCFIANTPVLQQMRHFVLSVFSKRKSYLVQKLTKTICTCFKFRSLSSFVTQ